MVLFRVKSGRSLFADFQTLFFSGHAIGFQIIIHPVWLGTKRTSLMGAAIDTFQCVGARFVMFCANIISDGLQSAFVLLCFVLTCLR